LLRRLQIGFFGGSGFWFFQLGFSPFAMVLNPFLLKTLILSSADGSRSRMVAGFLETRTDETLPRDG
jgi:hypothetical protein